MIAKGILKPGETVPSIRKMSRLYSMSPTPVIEAYKNLEAHGLIESHPKSRFTVAAGNAPAEVIKNGTKERSAILTSRRKETPNPYVRQPRNLRLDFARSQMESGIVPADRCQKMIVRVLRNDPNLLNTDPRGYDSSSLCAAVSHQMLQNMCAIEKEEICITGGGIEESIRLALKSCTRSGDTVVLTTPCSPAHVYACRSLGLNYSFVHNAPGAHSVDSDAFEHMLRQDRSIRCLLITGGLMNPNGCYIDNECKETLAKICEQQDIVIVEDDSEGALYFGERRPHLLKELIPEQTIYISSFTAAVMNELNIHWVCPGRYLRIFRMMRNNESPSPYPFVQEALAAYAASSRYRNDIEMTRHLLQSTVNDVRRIVFETFPAGTLVSDPKGGYNLRVILPEQVRNNRLRGVAYNNGVGISCDNDYFAEGNGIIINCSAIAADADKMEGIRVLGALATEMITRRD